MNTSTESIIVPELNDLHGDGSSMNNPQKQVICINSNEYIYAATFENEKDAEELVASEKVWSTQ